MKRLALAAPLAALLVAAATGTASPARHHDASVSIQILPGPPQALYGSVTSGAKRCSVGRRVEVFLGPAGVQPELVGFDVTSSNGDWFVSFEAPQAGEYRAVAVRKTYRSHGVRHVCNVAKSPRILNA